MGPGYFLPPEDDYCSTDFALEVLNHAYPGYTGVYLDRGGHMLAFYGRKGSQKTGLIQEVAIEAEVAEVVKAQIAFIPSDPLLLVEVEGKRKMDFLAKSRSQSLVGKGAIQVMSLIPSDSGLGASPTTGTTTRTLT